jgi:hypothetical protein
MQVSMKMPPTWTNYLARLSPLISNGELSKMNHHTDSKHRKDNNVKAKWNVWLNDQFQSFVE